MGFRLPCDWKPVLAILTKDKKNPHRYGSEQKRLHWEGEWRDQAVRTAWRIVKDWVEAQMALVETQMVTTAEVFLQVSNRRLSSRDHVNDVGRIRRRRLNGYCDCAAANRPAAS